MTDRIDLTGLTATGYHGVYDHERRDGQPFTVDLTLHLEATTSDEIADTVHYGELAEKVVAIIQGEPVNLIETLAHRIGDAVLEDTRVEAVDVTVHKPQAPIAAAFTDVSVTVRKERP
ncbi:MAG: dihydroneopterin aldolase [Microbacterium sp.]